MDPRWNPFRMDVDEAMADAQVQQQQSEQDRQRVKRTWQSIQNALEKDGPMAALLTQFREDAVTALGALIYADSTDSARIRELQADVQRSLRTMEHIDTFQNAAEVADANSESDEDLEQPLTESEE